MERGETYRLRMETLGDDGYKNASAHASPPRLCVARDGAGTSTNSTAKDQDALVARWVALQACVPLA